MKINLSDLRSLIELCDGGTVPSSRLGRAIADRLLQDGMLVSRSRGSRVIYCAAPGLRDYLPTLDESLRSPEVFARARLESSPRKNPSGLALDRASQVAAFGNSKVVASRSCPGFPVNCLEPVESSLGTITPQDGMFCFVSDWWNFSIPADVTVVGVENMENFRRIREQAGLFPGRVLFVSRYPQSRDLVRWLQSIPNEYVHFGDLDLAGVNIFLTEFYAFLGPRASFFIPPDVSSRLASGSAERYIEQYDRFRSMRVTDPRVEPLVSLIHRFRKGYDQEGFIADLHP